MASIQLCHQEEHSVKRKMPLRGKRAGWIAMGDTKVEHFCVGNPWTTAYSSAKWPG